MTFEISITAIGVCRVVTLIVGVVLAGLSFGIASDISSKREGLVAAVILFLGAALVVAGIIA